MLRRFSASCCRGTQTQTNFRPCWTIPTIVYFRLSLMIKPWITSDLFKSLAFQGFSEAHDNEISKLWHQTSIGLSHAFSKQRMANFRNHYPDSDVEKDTIDPSKAKSKISNCKYFLHSNLNPCSSNYRCHFICDLGPQNPIIMDCGLLPSRGSHIKWMISEAGPPP